MILQIIIRGDIKRGWVENYNFSVNIRVNMLINLPGVN